MASRNGNAWQAALLKRRRAGREVCAAHSNCDHAIVVRAAALLGTCEAAPVRFKPLREECTRPQANAECACGSSVQISYPQMLLSHFGRRGDRCRRSQNRSGRSRFSDDIATSEVARVRWAGRRTCRSTPSVDHRAIGTRKTRRPSGVTSTAASRMALVNVTSRLRDNPAAPNCGR